MKGVAVSCLSSFIGLSAVSAGNIHQPNYYEKEFAGWAKQYNVHFKDESEYTMRLKIFTETSDLIEAHNSKQSSYRLAHNAYSHLTAEEFADRMRLVPIDTLKVRENTHSMHLPPSNISVVPTSWDWNAKGAVTPVKDQGKCSSGGWAFSTTGAIEGAYQIKTKNLVSFSNQQLLSCDDADDGCSGGWGDSAFTWAKSNGGLCTEEDYPLTSDSSGSSGSCDTSCAVDSDSKPSSYVDVATGSVSDLTSAVYQQPVSIFIQANQMAIKQYSGGVFTGVCGQRLDHGVLAVGYGTDSDVSLDYWIVKNSWGTGWGEEGFIRIEKSDADRCGVLDAPSYPVL